MIGGGVATWTEKASGDNAAASATHAGVEGLIHYVSCVSASLDDLTVVAALQIKDGDTVIYEIDVSGAVHFAFPLPLAGSDGEDLVAELSAGGSGVAGKVSMAGFSASS